MNPEHLLRIARALAEGQIGARRGRPNQEELRKALSAAYYALFSALASAAANYFVGSSRAARKNHAWVQIYRSLNHGPAKAQCSKVVAHPQGHPGRNVPRFDPGVVTFAEAFVTMQELRLDADYNPRTTFYRSDVRILISAAEQAFDQFNTAPRADRRAFAAFIMHPGRGG